MAAEREYFDVEDNPSIIDIAERARSSGRAVEVREAGEVIGVFEPNVSSVPPRKMSEEDFSEFMKSAGAWKGIVDTDQLLEWIQESRSMPPRELPGL